MRSHQISIQIPQLQSLVYPLRSDGDAANIGTPGYPGRFFRWELLVIFDPTLVLTNLFKAFSFSERNPLDAEAVDVLRPPLCPLYSVLHLLVSKCSCTSNERGTFFENLVHQPIRFRPILIMHHHVRVYRYAS